MAQFQAAQRNSLLGAELELVLVQTAALRRLAAVPQGDAGAVDDLAAALTPEDRVALAWSYRNKGDYNQDGSVQSSDLTPIGVYFGSREGQAGWGAAQLADGNADLQVSAQDLVPIGLNYRSTVDGYLLERRAVASESDPDPAWELVQEVGRIGANLPPGGGALHFQLSVAAPAQDSEFSVRPFHDGSQGKREIGPRSNASQVDGIGEPLMPPQDLQASAGLFADRVQLTWTPVPGALRHLVYRDGGKPIAALGASLGAYVDLAVPDYLAHEYTVRAERLAELSPPSAGATGFVGERRGWPMSGGNPQHSGLSPREGPGEPSLRWVFNSGDSFGASAPVVADDGSIYIGSLQGRVHSVRSNGFSRWAAQLGGGIAGTIAVALDGALLVPSVDGKLTCLEAADGSQRWQINFGTALRSSPVVGPAGVIYLQHGSLLYSVSPAGQIVWARAISQAAQNWPGCPAVGLDGLVVVQGTDTAGPSLEGRTYAFSPAGELLWNYSSGAAWAYDRSPVMAADGQIYSLGLDQLVALHPDGSERWSLPLGELHSNAALDSLGNSYVNGGVIKSFKPDSSPYRPESVAVSLLEHTTPCLDVAGRLFVGGGTQSKLVALNSSGGLAWEYNLTGRVLSQPGIGPDGTLFCATVDGRIFAFRAMQ
jgi:outer membrane protein assembly factor BamB